MGNIFSQKQNLFTYKWEPPEQNDLFIPLHDLNDLTYPLTGKILIPFSQAHHQREFIYRNHHQTILLNDAPELLSYFEFQFRGIPIFRQEQLLQNVERCLQTPFRVQHCPIPIILQRFDESLLKSYLDAFVHYGVKVQYFESLQQFLNTSCSNPQLICSSIELQQLSCRIQNLTYSRQAQEKMTILCFCNKDQYSYPKKTQLAMLSNHIEVHFFHNMLQIVEKIHVDTLQVQPESLDQKQKVLFFLNQNEKEYQYLLRKGKKLQKTINNIKAIKTSSKARLVEKINQNQYLVVIFSSDSKEMKGHLDIFESLEDKGLEDRAIFLKRDSQMSYKAMKKIEDTLSRPKFIKRYITQKPLIFYGTLESFKFVLKYFPKLTFKKFIDKAKEQELLPFLKVRNEVVMTHLKVCECVPGWEQIRCKMIYVKLKHSTIRLQEQKEIIACSQENWFATEEEVIAHYQRKREDLLGLDCDYGYKKMSTICRILTEIFNKLKQKKTILINQLYGSIFLFSCQYYFLDQISVFITKYFNSKLLGSYDKPCLLQHLRFSLYRELLVLHRTARIQWEVISAIEKGSIANIFQLSDRVISLAAEYPYFFEEINSIWELLLHQDRPEYLSNCQVLLFLMLLSFNKTSFTQYHNETLQHLTLKIKGGLIAYEDEALSLFAGKTKNSFVYNFNFLLCEEYQKGQSLEPGDILIRLEGSQLNNFGLYLPVWKHEKQCLIAPLTKFELIASRDKGLVLKLSLNSQQKMLQKFSQHFLEDKGGLRLFKEPRQLRKLDCYLQSMCSGRYQTAGFIIKKMISLQQVQNVELLNAYIILHNLKCGEIEEAYTRLQRGKYYDLLSRLIASCREGSSVEAAHSEVTAELTTEDPPPDRYSVDSVNNFSATEMDLSRNDPKGKFKRNEKRSPSDIFRRQERSKNTTGRRMPVPVRHQKRKNLETSALQSSHQSCLPEEEQVKIKIFSPANQSITESKESFEVNKRITANFNLNLMDHSKEVFNCSLSRLNSCNSEKSFISELFQFDDPINETVEEPSLTKKQSKGKPSNFLQIEAQRIKNTAQTDDTLSGTGTITGKFNFGYSSNDYEEIVNEQLEEEEIYDMSPVVEEQSEKLSESEVDMRMLSATSDFFKFSLGFNPNGEKLIPNKRKSTKIPRSSIQQDRSEILQKLAMLPKLGNIQEECSCLPSNTNLSRSNINLLSSNVSDKENKESNSQRNITHRPQGKKLFTFCKNQEIRPRFSGQGSQTLKLPSSSLLVSQDSNLEFPEAKPISEEKEQLFCIFGQEEKSQLQSMNSISSIDLLDAEPVRPEDLMVTQTNQ